MDLSISCYALTRKIWLHGDRMRATTFLIISSLHTTLVTPVLLLMDRK